MEKHSVLNNISELKENLRIYLETKVAYFGMSALEKTVKLLTVFLSKGFVLLLLCISLLLFSAAASIYIGKLLQSIELGLLIVSGFFLLLGIVFYVFRERIFAPIIIHTLVNVLFQEDEEPNPQK
jgi:hypothetical protein